MKFFDRLTNVQGVIKSLLDMKGPVKTWIAVAGISVVVFLAFSVSFLFFSLPVLLRFPVAFIMLVGFVFAAIGIIRASLVYVPDGKIGVITASLPILFPSVPNDWPHRVVPRWHNGTWYSPLVVGWHWCFAIKVWGKFKLLDTPFIPANMRGVLISLIGQEIKNGQVMSTERLVGDPFKDPRGARLALLSPGFHNIFAMVIAGDERIPETEIYPFVIKLIPETEIEQGHGLVLISRVGEKIEDGWVKGVKGLVPFQRPEETQPGDFKQGVMDKAFGPGALFVHPFMHKPVKQNITPRHILFSGKDSKKGSPAQVGIFTREGYEILITFEISLQVALEDLPEVIAQNGTIDDLVNDVVIPKATDIIYAVGADTGMDDFVLKRNEKFTKVVRKAFEEEFAKHYTKLTLFSIKDVDYTKPAQEYVDALTRKLTAEKQVPAVVAETALATKQVELDRRRAESKAQPILVDARFRKEAAQDTAEATVTRGEALKSVAESLGPEAGTILKMLNMLLATPDGFNKVLEGLGTYYSAKN